MAALWQSHPERLKSYKEEKTFYWRTRVATRQPKCKQEPSQLLLCDDIISFKCGFSVAMNDRRWANGVPAVFGRGVLQDFVSALVDVITSDSSLSMRWSYTKRMLSSTSVSCCCRCVSYAVFFQMKNVLNSTGFGITGISGWKKKTLESLRLQHSNECLMFASRCSCDCRGQKRAVGSHTRRRQTLPPQWFKNKRRDDR